MTPEQRQHLKTLGVDLAALLFISAAMFAAGRYSAPLQVETRDVERVVYKDRVVEKVVTVQAKAETKIVYRDRVITRDGTVTEHEVEKTDTKETASTTGDRTAESTGASTAEQTTKTTLRPDWRVGILAGASLHPPLVPIAGPLVLGASVERRIVGGLSAGVWINTVGAAGASVSLEF